MIAPWAKDEVAMVDLGDKRLDDRLAVLLSDLGNRPNLRIPAACRGRAEMKAAYRFFDNDKAIFDKVIQPHVARTKDLPGFRSCSGQGGSVISAPPR